MRAIAAAADVSVPTVELLFSAKASYCNSDRHGCCRR